MVKKDVFTAFEILLEEIEMVIANLKEEAAIALQKSDYDKAEKIIGNTKDIEQFREKIKELQNEWQRKFPGLSGKSKTKRKRKITAKLKRGLRTPEDEFRIPILEAIVELGGSAPMSKVLNLVEKKMKGNLNEYDYQTLQATNSIRWKNTAQWCRNTMVREGLLKSDSPRGIWEISEKGIRYLQEKT